MALILLLAALTLLLAMGVPVAIALAVASLLTFAAMDLPLVVAFQRMAAGINIFSLMAIPFFVFAGDLMARAGIAERLVAVASAALGRVRGGLGQVSIGASALFGSVSGSAVASVSALGSTLIPMMRAKGYHADYAVNVVTCAAILGVLLPPSHNMILFAAVAGGGVSIADLFLAGVIPGLLTAALLAVPTYLVARRRGYPRGGFPGFRALGRATLAALPGLMTPVIIFVGILGGIFTPTESAAVAVLWTMLIATLGYRSLGGRGLLLAAIGAVRTTAMVMLIIAAAGAFGWLLAVNEAPRLLADGLGALADDPVLLLLTINLILLLLGTFMDMAPLIIITTPIFLPLAMQAGVSPVQFGTILMLNQGIGLVTPPVGSVQFVGAAIAGVRIEAVMRTIWPFYAALVIALMAITFIPELSLWLPAVAKQ